MGLAKKHKYIYISVCLLWGSFSRENTTVFSWGFVVKEEGKADLRKWRKKGCYVFLILDYV